MEACASSHHWARALQVRGYHVKLLAAQFVNPYLAEFEYHFNRRYGLRAMIPRFLTLAARTPPMSYRFLKKADS